MCKGLGYCQHWEPHQQGRAWLSCSSAEVVPAGGPASSTAAATAEEKEVEAKIEESEESEDNMGFGLFDYTSFVDVFGKNPNVKNKNKNKKSQQLHS